MRSAIPSIRVTYCVVCSSYKSKNSLFNSIFSLLDVLLPNPKLIKPSAPLEIWNFISDSSTAGLFFFF